MARPTVACPNCGAEVRRGNAHVNVARGVWICVKAPRQSIEMTPELAERIVHIGNHHIVRPGSACVGCPVERPEKKEDDSA